MDPVARRRLYGVIKESQRSGQVVVLTSHSMGECEYLCNRLAILVRGRMRCIGTVQHLKQLYAKGFTVVVRIANTAAADGIEAMIENIMADFNQRLVLKDEHPVGVMLPVLMLPVLMHRVLMLIYFRPFTDTTPIPDH